MRLILGGIVLAVLGFMAYVRLAPVNAATYHVIAPPTGPGDTATANSFLSVRPITADATDVLTTLSDIAMQTPRTQVIAGSVEAGMMTFMTRSRVFGFPDYTTASIDTRSDTPLLVIHGRLRYGASDLGVNQARIQSWLSQLGPLVASS